MLRIIQDKEDELGRAFIQEKFEKIVETIGNNFKIKDKDKIVKIL